MHSHENKTPVKNSHAAANGLSAQQANSAHSGVIDKKEDEVQVMANDSKQVRQLLSYQAMADHKVVQQKPVVQLESAEERAQKDSMQVKINIFLIARKLNVFQGQAIKDKAREFTTAVLEIMSADKPYLDKIKELSAKQDEIRKFITIAKKDTPDRAKNTAAEIAEAFKVFDEWELK